jgi:hypothetical protein
VRSSRRKATTGGILLWVGTTSIGVSTVVLLAVVSRHMHHHGFAGLSTLFGLLFVASLIPSGIPLRAAALIVDGAQPMRLPASRLLFLGVIGALFAPLVAFLLHLPVLAVVFVVAQILVALQLAIRRGSLIASQRFTAMGGNLLLEGGSRIVVGAAAGVLWGMTGLAAAIAVTTAIAMVTVPVREVHSVAVPRPITSMFHTWLALVIAGLFVQMDVLLAPSGLSKVAATRYDLAAVPSKGVYLLLAAVSTFIFPYVRVRARGWTVVLAALATMGLGVAVTGMLLPLRGIVSQIVGQSVASAPLLIILGAAMSIAGATGIVIYGGIALGVARPWPPLLPGLVCLFVVWLSRPSALSFGVVVLATQGGTLLLTTWYCLIRQEHGRHHLSKIGARLLRGRDGSRSRPHLVRSPSLPMEGPRWRLSRIGFETSRRTRRTGPTK